jgi:uncharacterized protein YkwD
MRTLVAVGALSMLVFGSAQQAVARSHALEPSRRHANALFLKRAVVRAHPARPTGTRGALQVLELDIVAQINAQRAARGLRPLRVSRGLTAAASYHSNQMGALGFFEHESRNGAPFWKRIQRFYPAHRGYWSVGENIFWEAPDTTAGSAVREWMASAPHRQNILGREWREVGIGAVHVANAPGAFGGRPVTIVTADFGVRAGK